MRSSDKRVLYGTVGKVAYPNRCLIIADDGSGVYLAKDGIEGQKVTFVPGRKKRGVYSARILEVREKSPAERRSAACDIFPECGGCLYQTMPYDDQIVMKAAQLKEILDDAVRRANASEEDTPSYVFEGVKKSPREFGFRNKMEFSFGDEYEGGPLSLGLHRKGSRYDVLTADSCKLVHEDMTKILSCVLSYFRKRQVSCYRKSTHEGYLRHLLLRRGEATGEILVGLVTASRGGSYKSHEARGGMSPADSEFCAGAAPDRHEVKSAADTTTDDRVTSREYGDTRAPADSEFCAGAAPDSREAKSAADTTKDDRVTSREYAGTRAPADSEPDLSEFTDELLGLRLEGRIVGILHIINDSLSDVVASDETRILYGRDYFYERLLGMRFKITPFSFFQPNTLTAGILYKTVRSYMGDARGQAVYDLFCGTGTISQVIAPSAGRVTGVDIVPEAVAAARENAAANGITNCEFIAGDVLDVIDGLTGKPDVIILDPPRDGVHPKALPKILKAGARKIIYISCKATSLARDMAAVFAAGYRLRRAVGIDQFCQSCHVETVALFTREEL